MLAPAATRCYCRQARGGVHIRFPETMPNAFDPYRETLVVETSTVWPDEYDAWEPSAREQLEKACTLSPRRPPSWTIFANTPDLPARSR